MICWWITVSLRMSDWSVSPMYTIYYLSSPYENNVSFFFWWIKKIDYSITEKVVQGIFCPYLYYAVHFKLKTFIHSIVVVTGHGETKMTNSNLNFVPKNTCSDTAVLYQYQQNNFVNFTWSIFKGSPCRRRASAGMMSPNLMLIMSPGTITDASSSFHFPSRSTYKFI